mgnify:CR=1 FL=1
MVSDDKTFLVYLILSGVTLLGFLIGSCSYCLFKMTQDGGDELAKINVMTPN